MLSASQEAIFVPVELLKHAFCLEHAQMIVLDQELDILVLMTYPKVSLRTAIMHWDA